MRCAKRKVISRDYFMAYNSSMQEAGNFKFNIIYTLKLDKNIQTSRIK